jgi:hypothetical protein
MMPTTVTTTVVATAGKCDVSRGRVASKHDEARIEAVASSSRRYGNAVLPRKTHVDRRGRLAE